MLETRTDTGGRLWVKVRLPVLPNGTAGWVRRLSLGAYQTVNTKLVVDRRRLLASLYRNGRPIFTAPVGVGTDSWPTPAGQFTVEAN
ncbi:MAG: L,D-transpeptidase family protein [Gaiellaceae bacterium]